MAFATTILTMNVVEAGLVDATSRYKDSKAMYWGPKNILTLTTYKREPIDPDDADTFMIIRKGQEYRPDKVSQDSYGTPEFWYKIMELNGMADIMEFKAGVNIRIPANVYF